MERLHRKSIRSCRSSATYAKQAGIKDNEIDYSIIGSAQILPKLVASLEAGNPPDITRIGTNNAQVYRSQGHLLDVTDMVNKMNTQAGGLFPVSLASVMHKGRAYSIPQSVSPARDPPGCPRTGEGRSSEDVG